jgi:hypothetical protein
MSSAISTIAVCGALAAGFVVAGPAPPPAGAHLGALLGRTNLRHTGEDGRVSESRGGGIELQVLPSAPFTVSMGGWFALGVASGAPERRDVYDFHVQLGLKPEHTQGKPIAPFLALGFDVLYVTSYEDKRTYRGTTLGASAQVGIIGYATDRLVYRAGAGYLGAIVPGTGDDLGGLVLQVGLGYSLDP